MFVLIPVQVQLYIVVLRIGPGGCDSILLANSSKQAYLAKKKLNKKSMGAAILPCSTLCRKFVEKKAGRSKQHKSVTP